MKTKFSKFLSLTLALFVSIGVFAFTSVSTSAADETDVLWVGGIEVTTSNAADILGDGTAAYDFETNTLTLIKANIQNGYKDDYGIYGIYSEGDLNIVLEDVSYITAPQDEVGSVGIFALGNLSFTGDNLVAKGGNVSGTEFLTSVGIYSEGSITVDNAVVEALGGDIQGDNESEALSVGVYVLSPVETKNDGHLAGYGGNINSVKNAQSYGVFAEGEETSLIYILVRDGGLLGHGGDVTAVEYAETIGLFSAFCDVAAFTVDSHMDFSGGKATSTGDSQWAFAVSNGAYIFGGSFGADGGNIYISSNICEGENIYGDAIVITAEDINGNPFGGYFVVTAEEILLSPNSPQFRGTNVKFTSQCGIALNAERGIIIDDNLTISVPENGYAGEADDSYTYYTINDKDGKAASNAEISVLTYKVLIKDASRSLAVSVPANFNINELYCEMLNVEDFAEYLITEKDGFVFEGWYYDEEFKNEFSFDDAITSNMTVYGKWTPVSDDSSDDVIDDSSDDVIDDSSDDVIDDSSDDVIDDSSDDVIDDSSDDVIDDSSDDVIDDSSDDVIDDSSDDVIDDSSDDVIDDSSDDVIDDSSDDVIDDSSDDVIDDSSDDVLDNSSEDVSNDKETEDAKPGDNGITFFAILLVLSLGAVLAVSKRRA